MNSRPKTLVILTPAFPADESPVNWVTTQQLFVRTLKEQFPGLKIVLLTLYYPYETSDYEWHGIPVTPFNGTRRRKLRRFMFWRSIWKKLAIIRKENEVIGLFSFWCGECALVGHYFGRWTGIRHLCWLCGQDARKNNKLVKFIRPRPGELIAMSDFLVVEFERNHGIRPRYMVPNAIGPEEFVGTLPQRVDTPPAGMETMHAGVASSQPVGIVSMPAGMGTMQRAGRLPVGMETVAGMNSRDIDILGVGTLSPFKQYDLLVEIIRSLQVSFPAIRGLHCGEGSGKEKLLGMIREAGLEAHLSLLGETPHRDVLALMQRTKVFLHTSDYEGFGVVCLEALHAGAHVISFIKPMEREIPHWHIVDTVEEMTALAGKLLGSRDTEYSPVTPFLMEDTVRSVMLFFDKINPATADGSTSPDQSRVIEQNRSYHDQAADSYDRTMDQDPKNQLIRSRVRETLISLQPAGRVLDFGGGTGLDLGWLTAQGYDVLFCEPSAPMREKAVLYNDVVLGSDKIVFLPTEGVDFTGWSDRLPFQIPVDAVLSNFGALNYIPDAGLLFRHMARVLRPGGHFVLLILHLPLKKRLKWHRRNALRSLIFRRPYVMYIPYEENLHQTVFVHTLKEIKKLSAPNFTYISHEVFEKFDFTLIHLRRNEAQD